MSNKYQGLVYINRFQQWGKIADYHNGLLEITLKSKVTYDSGFGIMKTTDVLYINPEHLKPHGVNGLWRYDR